jgi:hypothetical protein
MITVNTTKINSISELIHYFHDVFNHPSLDLMVSMANNPSLIGLPAQFTPANVRQFFPHACTACALGNLTQKPLNHSLSRKLPILQCGDCVQIDIISNIYRNKAIGVGIGNTRHILTAVDLFSDMTFTFRLSSCSNLVNIVKEIVILFKQYGHTIKRFEFDSQFNQQDITDYLALSDISFELAPPYEHAALGTNERKNRSLQETAIKLLNLDRSKSDIALWPFAFSSAAFSDAIRPKKRLGFKSSYHLFFHKPFDFARSPILPYLCNLASHIPVHLQGKLGAKSMICKSLGVSFEDSGVIRLLTPNKRQIIRRSFKSLYLAPTSDPTSNVDYVADVLESATEDDILVQAILLNQSPSSPVPSPLPLTLTDTPVKSSKSKRKSTRSPISCSSST